MPPPASRTNFLRPLGAFEELMWLFDLRSAVHFAMVAEIQGAISPKEWATAFAKVQQRHPLLSACIDVDADGHPAFFHVPDAAVPIRFLPQTDEPWQEIVSDELQQRFDPRKAPLIRATIVRDGQHSILVLVSHHSIGDALSLTYMLRDLLLALSGQPLTDLALKPSRETLFDPTTVERVMQTAPDVDACLLLPQLRPQIETRKLTVELTEALIRTSRQNGTTVHGALCAALAIAGRQQDEEWRSNALRILSSVSIRSLLGLEDDYMLSLGGGEVSLQPGAVMPFWELARWVKQELALVQTREGVGPAIAGANYAVASGLSVQSAADLLKQVFAAQTMISNLGKIDFPTDFGPLQLTSLWGPFVERGVEREQTVGALTIHQALHLTHSSPYPIPDLLATMEKVLRDACQMDAVAS